MKQYSKIFVYLRFSSEGQSEGNSFERQREAANAYLQKSSIPLSAVEWVEDPAFSAFHGDHVKSGALGKLLRRVTEKTLSNGLLIFESVDRASRQGSMHFISMLNEFLQAGFSIYFLDQPESEPFDNKSPPPFFFTFLSLKADLARLESQRKSDFSSDNWARRRHLARTENIPFSGECPRWLEIENQVYKLKPEMVESIRRVFELVKEGWGISKIVRFANLSRWPVPAKGTTWHLSLLNRLFLNRALIGEFQPHIGTKARRRPVGEPIEGYYPVAIDKDLFHEVQGVRDKASNFPNRKDANNYNYLMGLGKCECGGTWRRLNKNSGKQKGYAQYSCANRQIGATDCENLPGRLFDYNFISAACDQIPQLLTVVDDKRQAKKASLEHQLAEKKMKMSRLLELYELYDEGDAVEVKERLTKIKREKTVIENELKELERMSMPEGPFEFGDAVTAYLPAFLDVHDEGSDASQAALQARALFRVRLLQSVNSVVMSRSRKTFKVLLKNGVEFEQKIRNVEFTMKSDFNESDIKKIEDKTIAATVRLLAN